MANLSLGKRIAPPRFLLFIAVLALATPIAVQQLGPGRGAMIGFDLAATVFLLVAAPLLRHGEVAKIRATARANDANRALLLVLTGIVSVVVLVAVAHELRGRNDALAIALVIATLTLSWLFSNLVYAFHYAHLFYLDGEDGGDAEGIDFPRTDEPDYWDFIYFSFTLGMTFQTSDVDITAGRVRRVAIGHCLAAFVFNLGVIAFTINVLGK
jgi:uncharacterized membrane protein